MRGENLREFRGEFGEVAVRVAFRDNDKQNVEQLPTCRCTRRTAAESRLGSVARLRVGRVAGHDSPD